MIDQQVGFLQFPPPKSEYYFQQQNWESEYFFRKKP